MDLDGQVCLAASLGHRSSQIKIRPSIILPVKQLPDVTLSVVFAILSYPKSLKNSRACMGLDRVNPRPNNMLGSKKKASHIQSAMKTKEVVEIVDSEDEGTRNTHTSCEPLKTETSVSPEIAKCKEDRWRITEEEKQFLTPWYNQYLNLPHDRHRHPAVTAFKKQVADKFVRHFKFETDLSRHRQVSDILLTEGAPDAMDVTARSQMVVQSET